MSTFFFAFATRYVSQGFFSEIKKAENKTFKSQWSQKPSSLPFHQNSLLSLKLIFINRNLSRNVLSLRTLFLLNFLTSPPWCEYC